MPDGAPQPAVLGVERSLGGRRWQPRTSGAPEADERLGMALAQRLDLPEIVGRLLANRGVTPETAEDFLEPSLKAALPDPSHLRDMDAAVERIITALENREPTAVFGDYDVDGATSAALLHRYFAELGTPLRLYVPDRIAEGYGPNADALLRLQDEGIRLVLTVDCGISAHEPLTAAQSAGLDVVVLDHHVAEPALPPAVAVVNPNRLDEDSPHKALAAVGVTFLLLVALNRALRERGRFEGQPEPDLIGLLDLVALGTVCDVVP
ncbi:MAG: single-stranded-DNA-specific exonuclease RecJ, partial [Rhodospirillaceae bacterium]|nr:single-stranded-DNA-specific exonuclease RecJ [Rhodospirillaceae bacterium]